MIKNIIALIHLITIGNVDRISDGIITIEYMYNDRTLYKHVNLSVTKCKPKEGEVVFLYGDKIISCFKKNEKKENVHRRLLRKRTGIRD